MDALHPMEIYRVNCVDFFGDYFCGEFFCDGRRGKPELLSLSEPLRQPVSEPLRQPPLHPYSGVSPCVSAMPLS